MERISYEKTILFVVTAGWFFLTALPAFAAEETVADHAGLFTEQEIQKLNEEAEALNAKIKGEVFIQTTNSNTGDIELYTDRYLSRRIGNDNNGSALVIDMAQRKFHVSTSGNMIDYLTDSRLDKLLDAVFDQMAEGNYYQAALVYLQKAEGFVEAGVPADHYRIDRDTGKITYYKVITPLEIAICLAIAAVISIAFFIIVKSRYQLKMGGYKFNYLEKSSIDLTQKEDRLVNSFVTTRRIPVLRIMVEAVVAVFLAAAVAVRPTLLVAEHSAAADAAFNFSRVPLIRNSFFVDNFHKNIYHLGKYRN